MVGQHGPDRNGSDKPNMDCTPERANLDLPLMEVARKPEATHPASRTHNKVTARTLAISSWTYPTTSTLVEPHDHTDEKRKDHARAKEGTDALQESRPGW